MAITLIPPLYLVATLEKCPHCKQVGPVVAPAACAAYDDDEDDGGLYDNGFYIPTYIEHLPKTFAELLQKSFPTYFLDDDDDTDPPRYYMNHCAACGYRYGDRELHHHPGTAFAPGSVEECEFIILFEVPYRKRVRTESNLGWQGTLIPDTAKRRPLVPGRGLEAPK